MSSPGKLAGPVTEEVSDEIATRWEKMVAEADQDVRDVRVSFRWQKPQLDVIRRAAARFGIPYQTYVKEAAFRQALADLKASEAADELVKPRR